MMREEKGFFEVERRLDKSWDVLGGIVDIVENEVALAAQLKGVGGIVADTGGSEMGMGM